MFYADFSPALKKIHGQSFDGENSWCKSREPTENGFQFLKLGKNRSGTNRFLGFFCPGTGNSSQTFSYVSSWVEGGVARRKFGKRSWGWGGSTKNEGAALRNAALLCSALLCSGVRTALALALLQGPHCSSPSLLQPFPKFALLQRPPCSSALPGPSLPVGVLVRIYVSTYLHCVYTVFTLCSHCRHDYTTW